MESFADWGLPGLFILSFLAATVVPIGSETVVSVMLVAGYSFWAVMIIGTFGNWLGGMLGYYLGWMGKWEWISKYLRIKRHKVESWQKHIERYGNLLALICWVPGVGDFIAIGLGLFKVRWQAVAVYMLVGKGLRFVVWGYLTLWALQKVQ